MKGMSFGNSPIKKHTKEHEGNETMGGEQLSELTGKYYPGGTDYYINRDKNNKPVIFISHKNGTTPKDFQQYSGFKYLIEEYEEVRDFVKAVAESTYYTDQALAPKTLLTRGIKEEDIKKKAVYGYEHGKESFSVNNCQALIQGDIWLESKEDYYEINGTKLFTTPNIPSDEYEPVFGVSYRSNMSSMGIQNARFGIYSKDRYPNAVTI